MPVQTIHRLFLGSHSTWKVYRLGRYTANEKLSDPKVNGMTFPRASKSFGFGSARTLNFLPELIRNYMLIDYIYSSKLPNNLYFGPKTIFITPFPKMIFFRISWHVIFQLISCPFWPEFFPYFAFILPVYFPFTLFLSFFSSSFHPSSPFYIFFRNGVGWWADISAPNPWGGGGDVFLKSDLWGTVYNRELWT